MTYLQPELKALQISFSTFSWLCRWEVNGKFLIRSDIVNDGWGLLLQLLLLLLLLFSYLHLPFHYLPCIYDCNCILEKNQVFDSFFALLLLEDRLVRASSHITSFTNCIRWSFYSLRKNKERECSGFTRPICCILCHFLIQAFGFWASYVLRLGMHLPALISFYLQSSIFLVQYSDLLLCIEIAVPSFHQIPVLLAPFSQGQIALGFQRGERNKKKQINANSKEENANEKKRKIMPVIHRWHKWIWCQT